MDKTPEEIINFYNDLESITKFDRWELMQQITPLTEMFEHKWNEILITEQICLRFTLRDGDLIADMPVIDRNGKELGFPNADVFSDEQIKYIKQRIAVIKNSVLAARYNHILFFVSKNRKYAINAIHEYKKLIYLKLEDDAYDRFIPSIEAVIKLTEKIKFEVEETKKELIDLLYNDEVKTFQKHIIFTLIVNSALFKSHEFKFYPKLALEWSKDNSGGADYFNNKEILENAIKVCINNGIDTSIYYERLAENEKIVLEEHPDDADFIKTEALGRIVAYYKKSKNLPRYEKARREYTRVKAKAKLQLIDASPKEEFQRFLSNEINKSVKRILKWNVETILYHYSVHSAMFPNIENMISQATKEYNKSFLKHATSGLFDINNNVKILTDEENIDHNTHVKYMMSFAMMVMTEFIRVMQNGTYNMKISYYAVYKYFAENSWYGQRIEESEMRKDDSNSYYTWLDMMAPALHSFLLQLETSFLVGSKSMYTNWIIPIDSLTVKFEGALRDFIRIVGGSTSVLKNDEIREMLLEDMLNCDAAKNLFSNDDITLFKMVFTKKGDNIRNDVAHGFYHPRDYTMEKCCKIFLCILRLSRYKLVQFKEPNEDGMEK